MDEIENLIFILSNKKVNKLRFITYGVQEFRINEKKTLGLVINCCVTICISNTTIRVLNFIWIEDAKGLWFYKGMIFFHQLLLSPCLQTYVHLCFFNESTNCYGLLNCTTPFKF